jgi:hypothetical protein
VVAGHRIKAPLEYGRGRDKVWVFGALRVEDGKSITFTSRWRNSEGYLKLLQKIERAIPKGLIYLVADNLRTYKKSVMVRGWLEGHPRIEHAFTSRRGQPSSTSSKSGGDCSGDRRQPEGTWPTATR